MPITKYGWQMALQSLQKSSSTLKDRHDAIRWVKAKLARMKS